MEGDDDTVSSIYAEVNGIDFFVYFLLMEIIAEEEEVAVVVEGIMVVVKDV